MPATPSDNPHGRIRNAKKLLTAAALIMSVLLIGSSIVTTLLIPPEAFDAGGEAYGRALAYLAHEHLGETFGTIYDISTVAILWFAGASAMVGLLNLVPRYLPRYGMAPEWAQGNRPLVVIFTLVTFMVTVLFKADVDAQGGAYATGVLVLMGSAALAVMLEAWREGSRWLGYLLLTLIFVYTTVVNIYEKPEGHQDRVVLHRRDRGDVAGLTRAAIDRAAGARRRGGRAARRVHQGSRGRHRCGSSPTGPNRRCRAEYEHKLREARDSHHLPPDERCCSSRSGPGDVSAFSDRLEVTGVDVGGHRVLRCTSPAIPNAIAALLLTSATTPARFRTPISAGRKATRSPTC